MAQRYARQSKLEYWKEKGYEVVVGAKKLGIEGSNQLTLVEKKEKVEEPLPKKEEVKEDGRNTSGNVRRQGKPGYEPRGWTRGNKAGEKRRK
jgi:hypothetical protein